MAKVEIEDTELAELRKLAGTATKQSALAEALQAKVADAEKSAGRLKELEAQAATWAAEKLDTTFKGAGITDPKVRRVFQLEFDEQAAAEGGQKDLGVWLDGLKAQPADKRPAHLAPFLGAPPAGGTGGNAANQGTRPGLPNANKGAGDVQGAPPAFTPEQVRSWTPKEFAANYPKLQQLHPDQFPSIPLPSVPKSDA